jgi:hypothetical protein
MSQPVASLRSKRADIAGEIVRLQDQADWLRTDLVRVDAVLRMFHPGIVPGTNYHAAAATGEVALLQARCSYSAHLRGHAGHGRGQQRRYRRHRHAGKLCASGCNSTICSARVRYKRSGAGARRAGSCGRSLVGMAVRSGAWADRIGVVARAGNAATATRENENQDKEQR